MKDFLRLGTRRVACLFSPLLTNIALEVLTSEIRQEEGREKHTDGKGSHKTFYLQIT
jgi:hypothetical protein